MQQLPKTQERSDLGTLPQNCPQLSQISANAPTDCPRVGQAIWRDGQTGDGVSWKVSLKESGCQTGERCDRTIVKFYCT
ncbi:MAG: hypothetical protein WBA24_04140, partial [Geitlerinemataceae cyanobacterium]